MQTAARRSKHVLATRTYPPVDEPWIPRKTEGDKKFLEAYKSKTPTLVHVHAKWSPGSTRDLERVKKFVRGVAAAGRVQRG